MKSELKKYKKLFQKNTDSEVIIREIANEGLTVFEIIVILANLKAISYIKAKEIVLHTLNNVNIETQQAQFVEEINQLIKSKS